MSILHEAGVFIGRQLGHIYPIDMMIVSEAEDGGAVRTSAQNDKPPVFTEHKKTIPEFDSEEDATSWIKDHVFKHVNTEET